MQKQLQILSREYFKNSYTFFLFAYYASQLLL